LDRIYETAFHEVIDGQKRLFIEDLSLGLTLVACFMGLQRIDALFQIGELLVI
jgi:hypothetical protein